MAVPDPWRILATTDLILDHAPIREYGRYYHRERAIVIRTGLTLVQERAVLWHELVHAFRGDVACLTTLAQIKQESSVDREAARRAIPIRPLGALVAQDASRHDIADDLKTTPRLLEVRMTYLHPSERAYLARMVERLEYAA